MGVKRTGDWQKVLSLSKNLPNDLKLANKNSLQRVGLFSEKLAVKFMSSQSLNWEPLSASYQKRKEKDKKSEKILIRTSTYFQSITSTVIGMRKAFAGVFKKVRNDEGEIVADIAQVHEYGSVLRNIPARPLWRPVFRLTKKWIKRERHFEKNALRYLKKKYRI